MIVTRVAVAADGDEERVHRAAKELADELGLPLCGKEWEMEPHASVPHPSLREGWGTRPDLLLVVGEHRLELRETHLGGTGPVFVDFIHGAVGYRRRSGLSRRQPIALAVGLRRGPCTVVDATAGLARDSFLLACLGCTVIAVERSPVLGALIRDGVKRAAAEGQPQIRAIIDRITLIVDDARKVLTTMSGATAPDVVYVDPLYPPAKKAALPKKEMRICRRLVGDDADAGELLAVARKVAKRRVVVKRHPHAPPLAPAPALQFTGKKARYDVYCTP